MKTDTVNKEWFRISDVETIDSPALLIYADRVSGNILEAINMVGDPCRLRPHVKTHKSASVASMMMDLGIKKFKCSTIPEAEMLAIVGARDILLAYQPVGPKASRFIKLIQKYPASFSCLVDNETTLQYYSELAMSAITRINVFIDLNVGMNRTGIAPGNKAIHLYEQATKTKGVDVIGLHVYDGHIRNPDLATRASRVEEAFAPVRKMAARLAELGYKDPTIVAGGSPTFPVHARGTVECSPGTFVFWDKGYGDQFKEMNFQYAALVLARVISLPAAGLICVDLGHKAIAAENELGKRVYFLNAPELKPVSQSEEHLVLDAGKNHSFRPGDVLYGVPHHICPTTALYERGIVIRDGRKSDEWRVSARDRMVGV